MHSRSVALTPEFCNLPPQKQRQSCKAQSRASHLCDVRDGKLPRMSKICESRQGKRGTNDPNPGGKWWWFDIAMSIPSSENEDCHEDRGPNQLDPCDYCHRQGGPGGPGGARGGPGGVRGGSGGQGGPGGGTPWGGFRGTFMYYVTPLSFQACTATMDSDCSSLARRARRARKARSCNLLAILAHLAKPKELEDCCS